MFNYYNDNHLYTLGSTSKKVKGGIYYSRQSAKNDMYKYIDKKGLKIVDKYNDTHYKTYICNDGTRFFINRI